MSTFCKSLVATLRRAAWAPIVVFILHALIQSTTWRQPLDFAMHFSGGMAAAFFAWVALGEYEWLLGRLTPFGRLVFAFALACTVGVFWEFAELASDVFRGTHIQKNIHETMRDLIADALGAALILGGLSVRWLKSRPGL